MDILSELEDIERMMRQASMLSTVRQEVSRVVKEGYVVTDGSHQDGCGDYDVIVRCADENEEVVTRRLVEKVAEAHVSRIADGIIGLRRKYGE